MDMHPGLVQYGVFCRVFIFCLTLSACNVPAIQVACVTFSTAAFPPLVSPVVRHPVIYSDPPP